jgi:hypothetical protein
MLFPFATGVNDTGGVDTGGKCPPVSLTPVSTTLAKTGGKICRVDTGGKFVTGVVHTGSNFAVGVVYTGDTVPFNDDVNVFLPPRIFASSLLQA